MLMLLCLAGEVPKICASSRLEKWMDARYPRLVVLTGGPCGGKTTLLHQLRSEDPHARQWVLLPEVAPLLMHTGLSSRRREFQLASVEAQVALEEACTSAMHPGQVLLCHRGALDPLAYWLRDGGNESSLISPSEQQILRERYTSVLHLQTAAIDAVDAYRRWPSSHRRETVAEAAELDDLCMRVWKNHARYVRIENANRSWPDKVQEAKRLLAHWIN
jgi:hypothetical protein